MHAVSLISVLIVKASQNVVFPAQTHFHHLSLYRRLLIEQILTACVLETGSVCGRSSVELNE
jgi:hypothetical protein